MISKFLELKVPQERKIQIRAKIKASKGIILQLLDNSRKTSSTLMLANLAPIFIQMNLKLWMSKKSFKSVYPT